MWHSSLQGVDARGFDPATQLEGGHPATFAIFVRLGLGLRVRHRKLTRILTTQMTKEQYAALLPHAVKYFIVSSALM